MTPLPPAADQIAPDPAIPLPPYTLRMGGQHFKKDSDFVNAGVRDARVLRRRAGLGPRKRVLDWGCGAGRLAIGIKHLMGNVADEYKLLQAGEEIPFSLRASARRDQVRATARAICRGSAPRICGIAEGLPRGGAIRPPCFTA